MTYLEASHDCLWLIVNRGGDTDAIATKLGRLDSLPSPPDWLPAWLDRQYESIRHDSAREASVADLRREANAHYYASR